MTPNRRLKQARELRGWSQAKVAELIGTDATTVSRWERGLFSPTPYFRERLCMLFDKNAEELGLLEAESLPLVAKYAYRANEEQGEHPIAPPIPPSWPKRSDTFSYILNSAAHDQQAHILWEDAYVRALLGQYAEAQKLGEASLNAFECVGHLNATIIREWLNKQEFNVPPPSVAAPASTAALPTHSTARRRPAKRLLGRGSTGILFIMLAITTLFLTGFSFKQLYTTSHKPTASHFAPLSLTQATPTVAPTTAPLRGISSSIHVAIPINNAAQVLPSTLLNKVACNSDTLGPRCDIKLLLNDNKPGTPFTWQADSAYLSTVHTKLTGTGISGETQQITIYIQVAPGQNSAQILFHFTSATGNYTATTTWKR